MSNFKTLTLSANIKAPASMTNSEDSSSLTTAAVRPAALEAFPEVYTALTLNSSMCLSTKSHRERLNYATSKGVELQ